MARRSLGSIGTEDPYAQFHYAYDETGRGVEIRDAMAAPADAEERVRHVCWGMKMMTEVSVQLNGSGVVTSSALQKAHFWRPVVVGHADSLLTTAVEPSSADPARRRAALMATTGAAT